MRLSKALYDRSYDVVQVQQLLDFIDWLMVLDDRREAHFDATIRKYEEEKTMPTMSPMQKRFMAKGAVENRHEDILDILNLRFGSVPPEVAETVQQIENGKQLRTLLAAAVQVSTLDDFRRLL